MHWKVLKKLCDLLQNVRLAKKLTSKHMGLGSFSLTASTTSSVQSQKQSLFSTSHYIDLSVWETTCLCHGVPQDFLLNDFSRTLEILVDMGNNV